MSLLLAIWLPVYALLLWCTYALVTELVAGTAGSDSLTVYLVGLAVLVPLVIALSPRWPRDQIRLPAHDRGLPRFSRAPIPQAQAPELYAVLRDIDREHSPYVPGFSVKLTTASEVHWVKSQSFLILLGSNDFYVGAPLLSTLSVGEFRAYASRIRRRDTSWRGVQNKARVFAADAKTARRHGAASLAAALSKVEAQEDLFGAFFRGQWEPLLQAGYWVPLLRGFREHFDWRRRVTTVESRLRKAKVQDRIAVLTSLAESTDHPSDDRSAAELIANPLDVDIALISGVLPGEKKLTRLRWSQVYERVVRPKRIAWLRHYSPEYRGSLLADLPHDTESLRAWAADLRRRYGDPDMISFPEDTAGNDRFGRELLSAVVTEALYSYGWRVRTHYDDSYVFTRGDRYLYLSDLIAAATGDGDFLDTLEHAGIHHYRVTGAVGSEQRSAE